MKWLVESILTMKTNSSEQVIVCDVDNTLLMWDKTHRKPGKGKLKIQDPYTKEFVYLTPHTVHIRLLKQYSARGFRVIVWSAAGQAWAQTAVNALQLNQYVYDTMAKPVKFIDDKDNLEDILGTRVYLKNDI